MNKLSQQTSNYQWSLNRLFNHILYGDYKISYEQLEKHCKGNSEYTQRLWNDLLDKQIPYNPPHKALREVNINGQKLLEVATSTEANI